MGDMGRPLLQGSDWENTLERLLRERTHLYQQAVVRVKVAASDDIEKIANRTLSLVEARILPAS